MQNLTLFLIVHCFLLSCSSGKKANMRGVSQSSADQISAIEELISGQNPNGNNTGSDGLTEAQRREIEACEARPELISGILETNCQSCHNSDLSLGATNLSSLDVTVGSVNGKNAWRLILNSVEENWMPQGSPLNSADKENLSLYYDSLNSNGIMVCQPSSDDGTTENDTSNTAQSGAATLRRVSSGEYQKDVLALTGASISAQNIIPDSSGTFNNDHSELNFPDTLASNAESLAQTVAGEVAGNFSVFRSLYCNDNSSASICLEQIIEGLVGRAFKRSLNTSEINNLLQLTGNVSTENDLQLAVDFLINYTLQHFEYLYRIEMPSDDGIISDREYMVRSAYFIWGQLPTLDLIEQAESGLFSTEEQRRNTLATMIDDPKADNQIKEFHAYWLRYANLLVPQGNIFDDFKQEIDQVLQNVIIDSEAPWTNLFTQNQTWVNQTLAANYNLPTPQGGQGFVSYGNQSYRSGILSQGALTGANGLDPSITKRGEKFLASLICYEVPPPPPNVDADELPNPNATCKKDRVISIQDDPACAGCHQAMDNLGFAFDQFNSNGQFRTTEEENSSCSIDGQGSLPGGEEIFTGVAEFADIIIADGTLANCMTKHLLQFSIGNEPTEGDQSAIDALAETFSSGNYNFKNLMLEVALSAQMQSGE